MGRVATEPVLRRGLGAGTDRQAAAPGASGSVTMGPIPALSVFIHGCTDPTAQPLRRLRW